MTSSSTAGFGSLGHLQEKQPCISSCLTCFILITKVIYSEIYQCIMGKIKKIEQCHQSSSGSKPPKCNQSPLNLCATCSSAMTYYNQVCAIKQASRRQRNRDSAKLSRMKKEDKFSDLLATNIALTMQHEELVKELDNIDAARDALKGAIYAKMQEINTISKAKIP